MKVSDEEGVTSKTTNDTMDGKATERPVTETDRATRNTGRSTKHVKADSKPERQSEMSIRGREKLRKLRRLYQAELMKNMAFFQSARPYIELGSKPLSVQTNPSNTTGPIEKGDAMEQLD